MTYMIKVSRDPKRASISLRARIPIQAPQPVMELRIIRPYHPPVALENRIIGTVKADQRREESDIRFGDVVSE